MKCPNNWFDLFHYYTCMSWMVDLPTLNFQAKVATQLILYSSFPHHFIPSANLSQDHPQNEASSYHTHHMPSHTISKWVKDCHVMIMSGCSLIVATLFHRTQCFGGKEMATMKGHGLEQCSVNPHVWLSPIRICSVLLYLRRPQINQNIIYIWVWSRLTLAHSQ